MALIGRIWPAKAQPWVERWVLAPLRPVVETASAVRRRAAIRRRRERAVEIGDRRFVEFENQRGFPYPAGGGEYFVELPNRRSA